MPRMSWVTKPAAKAFFSCTELLLRTVNIGRIYLLQNNVKLVKRKLPTRKDKGLSFFAALFKKDFYGVLLCKYLLAVQKNLQLHR